jgi:uncharacterized protein
MTDQDYRNVLAQNWIRKARETLAAADQLVRAESPVSAVNRMYYAAFYAVQAVLIMDEKSFHRHGAVRSALHRDYVRSGRVPPEIGELYDELFDDRMEGDYAPTTSFPVHEMPTLLARTSQLVELLSAMVPPAKSIADTLREEGIEYQSG